jgi:hypothetical protein
MIPKDDTHVDDNLAPTTTSGSNDAPLDEQVPAFSLKESFLRRDR